MELLPENNHPINRAAKRALVSVGQEPWPETLHALQLAWWALETGRVTVEDYRLKEYVGTLLFRRKPEWGMEVVLVQVVDEDSEVPVDYSPGMSPEAFAAAVLSNILTSLMELNPDYLDADRLNAMRGR